jgi:hypothetical protein
MLKLNSNNCDGAGCRGFYFQKSRLRGIKIGGNHLQTKREGQMLRILNRLLPDYWPRFYKFVRVEVDGEKRTGILMEHIKGDILDHMPDEEEMEWIETHRPKLIKALERIGTSWSDDHSGNIIYDLRSKKWRYIDADMEYFRFGDTFKRRLRARYEYLREERSYE